MPVVSFSPCSLSSWTLCSTKSCVAVGEGGGAGASGEVEEGTGEGAGGETRSLSPALAHIQSHPGVLRPSFCSTDGMIQVMFESGDWVARRESGREGAVVVGRLAGCRAVHPVHAPSACPSSTWRSDEPDLIERFSFSPDASLYLVSHAAPLLGGMYLEIPGDEGRLNGNPLWVAAAPPRTPAPVRPGDEEGEVELRRFALYRNTLDQWALSTEWGSRFAAAFVTDESLPHPLAAALGVPVRERLERLAHFLGTPPTIVPSRLAVQVYSESHRAFAPDDGFLILAPHSGVDLLGIVHMHSARGLGRSVATYRMSNGVRVPAVLFGTGTGLVASAPDEGRGAIARALASGYAGLDTGRAYRIEHVLGQIFAAWHEGLGRPTRQRVFVSSKVWPTDLGPSATRASLHASLDDMGTFYLDNLMLHWPRCMDFEWMQPCESEGDWEDAWEVGEDAYALGQVLSLGVSNFDADADLHRLVQRTARAGVPPHLAQLHFNAGTGYSQASLRTLAMAKSHGIRVHGYAPLREFFASSAGHSDTADVAADIGVEVGAGASQVLLRWQLEVGCGLVVQSANETHQRSNLDVFSFDLSPAHLDALQPRSSSVAAHLNILDDDAARPASVAARFAALDAARAAAAANVLDRPYLTAEGRKEARRVKQEAAVPASTMGGGVAEEEVGGDAVSSFALLAVVFLLFFAVWRSRSGSGDGKKRE